MSAAWAEGATAGAVAWPPRVGALPPRVGTLAALVGALAGLFLQRSVDTTEGVSRGRVQQTCI